MTRTAFIITSLVTVVVVASVRGKDTTQHSRAQLPGTSIAQPPSPDVPNFFSRLTQGWKKTGELKHVTTEAFQSEVLRQAQPVLVDFYADWCAPCKALSPMLQQLASEYAGRVKIVKVNVDNEPVLAARYRVSGVPTMLLFHNGQPVDQLVGVPPVATLRQKLNRLSAASHLQFAAD
jgi:thioredoxin 1